MGLKILVIPFLQKIAQILKKKIIKFTSVRTGTTNNACPQKNCVLAVYVRGSSGNLKLYKS